MSHTTIIAPGTKVAGNLFSDGGIHIDGEVFGDIEAKSYVIVAPSATIHGTLRASEVYLSGHVSGDIWALELETSGSGSCGGEVHAFKINGEFTTQ